jgi:hypothetical protein
MNRLISLVILFTPLSCVHTQSHDVVRGGDNTATAYLYGKSLVFKAEWGNFFGAAVGSVVGKQFEFANAPAVVTYADGTKLEIMPTAKSVQFPIEASEKYPGYSNRKTKDWIYEIYKPKTTWGVPGEDHIATYDASPREEVLELGKSYVIKPAEEGFRVRMVSLTFLIPPKPMDIDVDLPPAQVQSESKKPLHFHIHYTDKWEPLRLAP